MCLTKQACTLEAKAHAESQNGVTHVVVTPDMPYPRWVECQTLSLLESLGKDVASYGE